MNSSKNPNDTKEEKTVEVSQEKYHELIERTQRFELARSALTDPNPYPTNPTEQQEIEYEKSVDHEEDPDDIEYEGPSAQNFKKDPVGVTKEKDHDEEISPTQSSPPDRGCISTIQATPETQQRTDKEGQNVRQEVDNKVGHTPQEDRRESRREESSMIEETTNNQPNIDNETLEVIYKSTMMVGAILSIFGSFIFGFVQPFLPLAVLLVLTTGFFIIAFNRGAKEINVR